MVADYLKKAGFEYSLSVFLPEAGVNIDKVGRVTLQLSWQCTYAVLAILHGRHCPVSEGTAFLTPPQ